MEKDDDDPDPDPDYCPKLLDNHPGMCEDYDLTCI